MENILAIKVNDFDNVATIFNTGVEIGDNITVLDKKGNSVVITASSHIPYGHKIAVRDIEPADSIIKYGETIGAAIVPIKTGDHAHIHNLDSMRGRGDL